MNVKTYLIFVYLCSILTVTYSTVAAEWKISQLVNGLMSNSSESAPTIEESDEAEETTWTNINAQVDVVIPMVLNHLNGMQIEHMHLPDLSETISLTPILAVYQAQLILSNGIVYNVEGIKREGNALMTYRDKIFIIRFDLKISNLQFEYDFLLQLMPVQGYGKVMGALEDTIVHAEMSIDVTNISLTLNKFRLVQFRKIYVQLEQIQLIRQLTGLILTPITNLFKDRITTSISDGLEKEMGTIFEDFNVGDPLQLRMFAKKLLSGLTGQ
ncbi:uncharacterized protein LOC128866822 [Anastrepha ludens]|uniref:uncharacterized protein LOC128866822 n=1 Tax=Anastrepha ludens TaxID=28586 RepID=UPI0023B08F48|nr:uncharacterized protein LOC128866822 [Anastrepha ludens]